MELGSFLALFTGGGKESGSDAYDLLSDPLGVAGPDKAKLLLEDTELEVGDINMYSLLQSLLAALLKR